MKTQGISSNHFKRRARARGISLLDTLVTVSVVSSVSAVALPKLNGLPSEARMAVVEHMAGAVRSASHLVHMKCAVQATCDLHSGVGSVEVADSAVSLLHGYPQAGSPEGIANAIEYVGFTAHHVPDQTWFGKDGAPEPAACGVRYVAPVSPGQPPQVAVVTSGC
jgi:MSHA pilin protein MshA